MSDDSTATEETAAGDQPAAVVATTIVFTAEAEVIPGGES